MTTSLLLIGIFLNLGFALSVGYFLQTGYCKIYVGDHTGEKSTGLIICLAKYLRNYNVCKSAENCNIGITSLPVIHTPNMIYINDLVCVIYCAY